MYKLGKYASHLRKTAIAHINVRCFVAMIQESTTILNKVFNIFALRFKDFKGQA